jgi:WhiB family redox-sensing transcriptional regulator
MNLGHAPNWLDSAACRDEDTDLFFPGSPDCEFDAVAICEQCCVRTECFIYALDHAELTGIWGGSSDDERSLCRRAVR